MEITVLEMVLSSSSVQSRILKKLSHIFVKVNKGQDLLLEPNICEERVLCMPLSSSKKSRMSLDISLIKVSSSTVWKMQISTLTTHTQALLKIVLLHCGMGSLTK